MRWERGFRRLTIFVSGVLLIVGFFMGPRFDVRKDALEGLVFAAIPWLLFLLGRWLIKGFRDDVT